MLVLVSQVSAMESDMVQAIHTDSPEAGPPMHCQYSRMRPLHVSLKIN
jgi:hypothetical protein